MLKDDFFIAALIAKSMTDSLSEEEARQLDAWKIASERNQALFDQLSRKEKMSAYARRAQKYDTPTAWDQVESRIRSVRKRNLYMRFLQYAAIFLLPCLAGIGIYYLTQESRQVLTAEVSVHAPVEIKPGGSKALLTLGNGRQVCLDADSIRDLEEAGAQIQVRNTQLAYEVKPADNVPDQPVYNKIETPRGGEYKLTLSDGTQVHLNAMSVLRYPVQFDGNTREVELTGEAFFEVTRSNHPFIVKTKGMQVQVLGTVFNVSAYPENLFTQTTLLSGAVKVHTSQGNSVELKPSQQAELDNRSAQLTVRTVDPFMYTSWAKGKIYFKDERLEDILTSLARWYDVDIAYEKESLKNLRFGCNLNRYEAIEPFLNLLKETGKLHTRIEGRKIIIY